uniref:Uncharacterized protein n=1 Tax=Kalanchoe fedtschenkoi TaxID=63787 RepID=A0A7N0V4L1_KALFE
MAVGKGLIGPLLAVNSVGFLIVIFLASWSLDRYIHGQQHHHHLGGNSSTIYLLMFAILGGVLGGPSVLSGLVHTRIWRRHSLAVAVSLAFLSWTVMALAFGLTCKEIAMGGHRGKRLQTLEAFIAISGATQLLYLILLSIGMFHKRCGTS